MRSAEYILRLEEYFDVVTRLQVTKQDAVPPELYDWVSTNLVPFADPRHPRPASLGQLEMLPPVKAALEELLEAAQAAGHDPYVSSAFRSIEKQAALYEESISEIMETHDCSRAEAEVEVSKLQAKPGHSEHHLGVAVDVFDDKLALQLVKRFKEAGRDMNTFQDAMFADAQKKYDKGLYGWLRQHAHTYGFILSYPVDTSSEYDPEPWHLRFVGKQQAKNVRSELSTARGR